MKLFSFLKKPKQKAETEKTVLPWQNLPPIFLHIKRYIDATGMLSSKGNVLPDQDKRYKDNGLRWVSGGQDSILGFNGGNKNLDNTADKVATYAAEISLTNNLNTRIDLYKILIEDNVLAYIETAMEKMASMEIQVSPHLDRYARWLAFQAPHRGAVKLGIALLGIIGNNYDKKGLITLGKHEEFTLFAAVAIMNMSETPELDLWNMAKYVSGWGKINIVERLAETNNPDIKNWLLREGFKNTIMYEYLAYTCAVAGNLKQALTARKIDTDLFKGAGTILTTLLNDNSPVEDIYSYEDGAEALQLYLNHMTHHNDLSINEFIILHRFKDFLEDTAKDWKDLDAMDWTEDHRANLLIDIHTILSKTNWNAIVKEQLENPSIPFWQIKQAGKLLHISTWDTYLQLLTNKPICDSYWFFIHDYVSDETIDLLIDLAKKKFDLSKIASSVQQTEPKGAIFEELMAFDSVLYTLAKYPGKGVTLLKAGLESPLAKNRYTVTYILSEWGTDNIPSTFNSLLKKVLKNELEENLIKRYEKLLNK
ncbi:hypothetical protein NBRC110019_20020 [Neptunitalea chrysea]|uniref:Limonene hydroxylase n=1 Tax=Neptunitalea chrysea TaxID=1647581 RepID=A0A9W6B7U9_9FLAO|nr:hypothetical protein [Neptunitalea chrysea]GLB52962.1 hypothetical protein NBRC110019_20020 [Neptunitalea chrysea]